MKGEREMDDGGGHEKKGERKSERQRERERDV